jgi:hypothetical protein
MINMICSTVCVIDRCQRNGITRFSLRTDSK